MTFLSGVLFLHVTSSLGFFAALSLEVLVLYHLRRAASAREALVSLHLAPGVSIFFAASAVLMLLTGVYLTVQMSAWPQSWLKIAMAALFLMAPLGAVSGRRMRLIRREAVAEDPNGSELIRKLQDPVLTFSLSCRMALVLGIVLLMTAKPELRESIGVCLMSLVLGFASAVLFWRGAPVPAARAPFGNSR